MATTKISDLVINPSILQEAIQAAFAGIQILNGSPAVIVKNTLPRDYVGGQTVTIPYFDNIGDMDDIATEGDALTPAKVTESSETATVKHSGKAVEATYWARLVADPLSDPYEEMARQLRVITERRVDKALIDAANTSLPSMTVDHYSASSPRTIDLDFVLEGRQKWGDRQEDFAMIAMHSKVLFDLLKLKDSTGRPLVTEYPVEASAEAAAQRLQTGKNGMSPDTRYRFAGLPVYVSDRLVVSSDSPPKYTTLILKKDALVFWYAGEPQIKTGEDILANTNLAAVHLYYAAYRYKRLPTSIYGGVALLNSN